MLTHTLSMCHVDGILVNEIKYFLSLVCVYVRVSLPSSLSLSRSGHKTYDSFSQWHTNLKVEMWSVLLFFFL